jgi:hypothetical protein
MVEKELANIGIEPFRLFTSTGNKQADYLVNKNAPYYVNMVLGSVISTPWYDSLSKADKKVVIKKRMTKVRSMVKGIAESEAFMQSLREGKGYTVFEKAQWTKATSTQKRLAEEYFNQVYGKSISELGAYSAAVKVGRALEKAL